MSVTELLAPRDAISAALGLGKPIRDEAHYAEVLAFVDECFDRYGGDDQHPIFDLVSLVADQVREYEDRVQPWPDTSTPASRLAFMMDQHGLRQGDLPEVGTQGVISEILAGKRRINLRQAKAQAQRFRLPIEAFAD